MGTFEATRDVKRKALTTKVMIVGRLFDVPSSTTREPVLEVGLRRIGFMSAIAVMRPASACIACARSIPAPSSVERHVLCIERRDALALIREHATERRGDERFADVRCRAQANDRACADRESYRS